MGAQATTKPEAQTPAPSEAEGANSPAPDQYGVIGHPIAHSWSPFIHGLFARQTEQAMVYKRFDVPPANFRGHVSISFCTEAAG